ncbi:MAG: nucleotidyltransferase domain-containing protein [Halobacteriales archaeon]
MGSSRETSVRRAARRLATAGPAPTPWAVTRSANLALRGYDVEPDDLDVKTDAAGVRTIVDSVPDAVVSPVTPGTTDADWIRSHFAVLELEGATVELVGDAEVWDPAAERWVSSPPVEGN